MTELEREFLKNKQDDPFYRDDFGDKVYFDDYVHWLESQVAHLRSLRTIAVIDKERLIEIAGLIYANQFEPDKVLVLSQRLLSILKKEESHD